MPMSAEDVRRIQCCFNGKLRGLLVLDVVRPEDEAGPPFHPDHGEGQLRAGVAPGARRSRSGKASSPKRDQPCRDRLTGASGEKSGGVAA